MKNKADKITAMLKETIKGKINQSYWLMAMVKLGDITESEAGYIFNQL